MTLDIESDLDREPLDPDEERAKLDAFLKPFDMMPDVRSQVEAQFWRRKGLYYAIIDNVSAYDRLVANFRYADEHEGNVVIELWGRKRHSKSTVARWICCLRFKLRTGAVDGWEAKVIYKHAYSGTTDALQELATRIRADVENNRDMIARLRGYTLVQDESQIEHEKDSVKAQHDIWNIGATCSVAGIDMYYLSTKRRGIDPDFSLWVIGIDKRHGLNLSFYFDTEGHCHGYLVTRNVDETEKYKTGKDEIVAETLLHGGRRPAQVKAVNGAAPTEAPVQIVVEPNADFMTVLEQFARQQITPFLKEPHYVERWLQRYFRVLTFGKIAELEREAMHTNVSESAVRIYLVEKQEKLPNTTLGTILEEALTAYLNTVISDRSEPPNGASVTSPHQQTFLRRGGPGEPDVATGDGAVQVNCKLFLAHRSSWQLDARPEHRAPHGWLVHVELGPPQPTHRVYPLRPDRETVATGSVEEVAWEAWLQQLRVLKTPHDS